jgi:hypothetical protein
MRELLLKVVTLLITTISVVVVERLMHHPELFLEAWNYIMTIEPHWWFLVPVLLLPILFG